MKIYTSVNSQIEVIVEIIREKDVHRFPQFHRSVGLVSVNGTCTLSHYLHTIQYNLKKHKLLRIYTNIQINVICTVLKLSQIKKTKYKHTKHPLMI